MNKQDRHDLLAKLILGIAETALGGLLLDGLLHVLR
jgi:hypothetical protein